MVIHFQPKENNFKIRRISNLEKVTNIIFSIKKNGKQKAIKKNYKFK